MKVVQLKSPVGQKVIYRVYRIDKLPFNVINKYLIFLENKGNAPNSVRAYAYDLVRYFEYLRKIGKAWEVVAVDDWAGFVQYLKYSTADPNQAILPVAYQQARQGVVQAP